MQLVERDVNTMMTPARELQLNALLSMVRHFLSLVSTNLASCFPIFLIWLPFVIRKQIDKYVVLPH